MTRAADGVWALVPVKSFGRGKSRLAPVLDDTARAALARAMFERVLGALEASAALAGILVITDGAEVVEAARARGAAAMLDLAPAPLGRIVDGGLAALADRGASAALVVMGDLPDLDAVDARRILALLDDHDLVIAPDASGDGTGALALRPVLAMPSCFGNADSFSRHVAAARAAGLRAAIYHSPSVAFDVDAPEDYRAWLKRTTCAPTAGSS